jgi:Peptidase S41 N-terminal domain
MTARPAPGSRIVRLGLALLAAMTLSCGGGDSSPTSADSDGGATTANCTTLGQCTFVRDTLQSYYYWYEELPNPDPGSFASP